MPGTYARRLLEYVDAITENQRLRRRVYGTEDVLPENNPFIHLVCIVFTREAAVFRTVLTGVPYV
jgi:hypothetical protein